MIKPTIGRVVWFFPSIAFMASINHAYSDPTQPLAAIVSYVWSDEMVNLSVHDQNGKQFNVTSVPLLQEGEPPILGASFHAEWMPYQAAQAKKDAMASEGKPDKSTTELELERVNGHAITLQGSLDQAGRELAGARLQIESLQDLLSSARVIAQRNGEDTAWQRFDERIASLGIGTITAKTFKVLPSDKA